jgi:hypothetical protein
MTTSGETTSTACPIYSTCSNTGSSNYAAPSLTFSTTTGKFSGTFVTNQCPGFTYSGQVRIRCERMCRRLQITTSHEDRTLSCEKWSED